MKLEQSFTVEAPIEEVWAALVDVERVAPCLPGAQITGRDESSGAYRGTFSVKLGPTTAAYNGTLRLEQADEATRRATMSAKGTDKRGQGGANATIVSVLREEGDATVVDVDTDFSITGRLARFGRSGMIEDISKRLLRDFSACLAATLQAPPTAAEEADAAVASAGGAAVEASAAATGEPPVPPPAASEAAPPQPGAAASAAGPPPAAAPPPRPAPAPVKPVSAGSLAAGVVRERLKRLWARVRQAVNERRRRS
jgi:uncharacterized protein